jgi:hypothetical protein
MCKLAVNVPPLPKKTTEEQIKEHIKLDCEIERLEKENLTEWPKC